MQSRVQDINVSSVSKKNTVAAVCKAGAGAGGFSRTSLVRVANGVWGVAGRDSCLGPSSYMLGKPRTYRKICCLGRASSYKVTQATANELSKKESAQGHSKNEVWGLLAIILA